MDRQTAGPIVVRVRNGGQIVLQPEDRYQVLLDDNTWQWRRARELAVGDVLQGRGRIVVKWGGDGSPEAIIESAAVGADND